MNHSTATPRWSPQLVQAVCSADVSLAAAATMLADNGIPAFPCAPGQKHPLTPHGFHDASSDRGVVASWWKRWPEANIGIVKALSRSGLLIVMSRTPLGLRSIRISSG